MPILDPYVIGSLNHILISDENSSSIEFFITFLKIASKNINQSFNTVESAIQFREDVSENILISNFTFKCHIKYSDLNNPTIFNIYDYLYNKMNLPEKTKKHAKIKGNYFYLSEQPDIKYFAFYVDSRNTFWLLSDTPVAILYIEYNIPTCVDLSTLKLEIDLMTAAGFTLVLFCIDRYIEFDEIFEIIQKNQFAEVHYYSGKRNSESIIHYLYRNNQIFNNLKSYFYFYVFADEKILCNEMQMYKYLKTIPRINISLISQNDFSELFNNSFFRNSKPFPYCKNGFNYKYIRILLSNVPLYDSEDNNISFTPCQTSGIGMGFILKEDYFDWKKKRVKILFDDKTSNSFVERFIDFDDIHKLRTDLYLNDQLKLAKILDKTIEVVEDMGSNIESKTCEIIYKEKFKKDRNFSIFLIDRIQKNLEYVSSAYNYAKYLQNEKDFYVNNAQIFTAFHALRKFLGIDCNQDEKGIIFKVDTGEGKSCIVFLIAAVLAKMKKTVHITSSNILLSKRDFEDSYIFFKMLGISSAVLLHSHELPLSVRKRLKFNNINNTENKDSNSTENKDSNNIENKDSNNIENKDSNNTESKDSNNSENKDSNNSESKDLNKTDNNDSNKDKNDQNSSDDEDFQALNNSIFKDNINNYYKDHTHKKDKNIDEYYSEKYYNKELFKNSSRMNFSVCGLDEDKKESKNKANVIYSTFVNFECFYLKMIELCPASIESYFTKCGLLIDEADSMLIDEIANGTIFSRSMKSNAIEILKFVYQKKKEGIEYNETFKLIKQEKKWSNCKDLKEFHIKQMYEEIDQLKQPGYKNGQKYTIETKVVKNESKTKRLIKKALNVAKNIIVDAATNFVKEFTKDPNGNDEDSDDEDEDDDDDDDDDDEEEDDESGNDDPTTTFSYIVPFGYESNGMPEKSKEFGGFIQQFIAIKESEKIENMLIRDISMSYLYISHPIFIQLYGTVCGFTGTIGSKHDINIYKEQYKLTTFTVPRSNPNQGVELPMILCESIEERNQIITEEVLSFHKRKNPVLVIFQDLTEIDDVEKLLLSNGIKLINIFDGKDDMIEPDEIAGINGSISLGTNVCGRGTNIKAKGLPLHVIVAYYSSNKRVMNQAFGRTARQGKKGTYRIICLDTQYYSPKYILTGINQSIKEFEIKNRQQRNFVDHFKNKRDWIFSSYLKKQITIEKKYIIEMREAKINVNRIVAYNYKFPICMSITTFITIQIQKIFSIFNCPNSEFTWKIFQRYIRELILESWSLMINELDRDFAYKEKDELYEKELINRMKNLYKILDVYLPQFSDKDIVSTFMNIFRLVVKQYETSILNGFKKFNSTNKKIKNVDLPLAQHNKYMFFSVRIGFKPYSLYSKSGARILSKNFKKTNYIHDPELKYEQTTIKNKFSIISITRKIDDIFNYIFMKANDIIGSKTFLKLFVRRTLAGCEFGFCINNGLINNDIKFMEENPYCIVDKDPLLVFTIFVKSTTTVIAIILISLGIYLGIIGKRIADWFIFPQNAGKALKKTASIVINAFEENISKFIFEEIIKFLEKNLNDNIKKIESYDEGSAEIFQRLKNIFDSKEANKLNKKFGDKLKSYFEVKTNWSDHINNFVDFESIMKISVYILLLSASFIMNYRHNKKALANYETESADYNNNCDDENKAMNKIEEIRNKHENEYPVDEMKKISSDLGQSIEESYNKKRNTFQLKMAITNILEFAVKSSSFIIDKKSLIENGLQTLQSCSNPIQNKKLLRVCYKGLKNVFLQQVKLYSVIQYPSIIKFVGYEIEKHKQYIFIDSKEKGTLNDCIFNSKMHLNLTNKLIIAYGISCAMEYLHQNKIVHRNLNPSIIFLDSKFYPYVSDFYNAIQTETFSPYLLKKITLEYMAPEFIDNFKDNQASFQIDIYSFGITLFSLIFEKKPYLFNSNNENELLKKIKNNDLRPKFPNPCPNELVEWKNLIIQCWNKNPSKRPSFNEICKKLENPKFVNDHIDKNLFKVYKEKILNRIDH